jgi:hypothetical protein
MSRRADAADSGAAAGALRLAPEEVVVPLRVGRRALRAGATISVPGACHISGCKSAARARENAMSIAKKTKHFDGIRESVDPKHSLGLLARIKRYQKNAEIIFDADEPIGAPTDLVMPRRRWFGRTKISPNDPVISSSSFTQP